MPPPPPLPDASTRDVWCINRAGSLDRLARRREPLAPPRPGEARIRVHAAGVNFADVFAALGLYSATPRGPFVPGLEIAGVVEALAPGDGGTSPSSSAGDSGADDTQFRPGDRVVGLTRFGGYASAVNLDVRYLRRLPDDWSLEQGAAFPVQALTAYYGLVSIARVRPGDVVLIHSAAGGVGLHALAIARAHGARVVATVGDERKRAWLTRERGLPAEAIVVRDRRRFGGQLDQALRAIGGDGVDVVFDAVLGPYFDPAWQRLRPEGRYVLYGAADYMPRGARPDWMRLAWRWLRRPRLDPLALVAANRTLAGFNLIWLWDHVDQLAPALDAVLATSPAPPHIGARFAFEDAPAAMHALQGGKTIGKVVITV